LAAYAKTNSVWDAAKLLGMCGQSVHERLVKLGKNNSHNIFTEADHAKLRTEYEDHANAGTLHILEREMRRLKSNIAREARKLGLTTQNRKRAYQADGPASERMKAWHAVNEHPRGMLGKKHSEETRDRFSQKSSERWHSLSKDEQIAFTSKAKVSWKQGWREIGGKRSYYRSSWEANYARYLEWLLSKGEIASWEHEPETFWFHEIKRGCRSYLPDFKVIETNQSFSYHEVKGWMNPESKTKIKRMAKYYPQIKLIVIDGPCYKSIAKTVGKMIEGWE